MTERAGAQLVRAGRGGGGGGGGGYRLSRSPPETKSTLFLCELLVLIW